MSARAADIPLAVELTLRYNDSPEDVKLLVLRSVWESSGISTGGTVTAKTIATFESSGRAVNALSRAFILLSAADNSKRSLVRKLRERGFAQSDAEAAARELCIAGYINEPEQISRIASILAERRLYGRRRIIEELYRRGYSPENINHWRNSESLELDFAAICAKLIARRGGLPPKNDTAGKRKLLSYLYRRGFSSDDIREAVRYIAERGDDSCDGNDDGCDITYDDTCDDTTDDI